MRITLKIPFLIVFLSSLLFLTPLCAAESEITAPNPTAETETVFTADESEVTDDSEALDATEIDAAEATTAGTTKISDLPDLPDDRISTDSTLTESFAEPSALTDPSILIIDASANMHKFMQGVNKLTIETVVVSDAVSLWNQGSPLGLIAYGHNRSSDCNDISLLQPVDSIDKETFLNKLKQLKATGESPYITAVKTATRLLDHRNNKANIILISGGKDSCNLDPCAAVKSLTQESNDLTAHVINFNAREEDAEGLRCLAHETGGIYLEATTPDELKIALNEIRAIVTEKPQIKITKASVSVNVEEKIVAGSLFEVNWEGPENHTDKLIIKSEDQEKSYHYQYLGNTIRVSPSQLIAPESEGIYEVHYQTGDGESLAKTTFKVVSADATLDTNKQMLAKTQLQINWTGPKNLYDKIAIIDLETETPFLSSYAFRNRDKSPTIVETPDKLGHYEIRYLTKNNKVLAYTSLDIVRAIISAPVDVTSGSIFNVIWVGPSDRLDNIAIFDTNNRQLASKSVFRIQDVSPAKLTAPGKPGEYEIRYQTENNTILAKQNFTVTAATASIGADGEVSAGSAFNINWIGPDNAGDMIAVYDPLTNTRYDFTYFSGKNISSPAYIAAPEQAGNYEIRYISNHYTLASQPITVIPAKATINTVDVITVGYKFYVNWTGPKNNHDMVAVFNTETNKSFSPVYVTEKEVRSPTMLTAPMTAGTYEIRYYTKGGNTLASQIIQVLNEDDEDEVEENDINPLPLQKIGTPEENENENSEAGIIKN